MGICWSCLAGTSSQVSVAAPAGSVPTPIPVPDPDPAPSTVVNLLDPDGDTSFLGHTGHSWFSTVTTNFSALMSHASGALAAIWGEDNEFPMALDGEDDEALPDGVSTVTGSTKSTVFTFQQLKAATFDFRSDLVLGRGGFGNVYKGWLKEKLPSKGSKKRPIAVKKLDSRSKQGYRQWRTEVDFLGKLSHPNIVKLLGYCGENEEYLIAYEFMEKGSLNYHLFGKKRDRMLPWETGLQIGIGMAQGLSYLHTMEKPIIFRDFKSSNVLLDEFFNPKISDFGLAKWGPTDGNSFVTGHRMGTIGYTDPYSLGTGEFHIKSDVYSFGVVLVEMLTGLRAYDRKRVLGERSLDKWILNFLSERKKLKLIMDSRLEGKYAPKQASQIARLATRCLDQFNPKLRPSMKEVAETLELIQAGEYN